MLSRTILRLDHTWLFIRSFIHALGVHRVFLKLLNVKVLGSLNSPENTVANKTDTCFLPWWTYVHLRKTENN